MIFAFACPPGVVTFAAVVVLAGCSDSTSTGSSGGGGGGGCVAGYCGQLAKAYHSGYAECSTGLGVLGAKTRDDAVRIAGEDHSGPLPGGEQAARDGCAAALP